MYQDDQKTILEYALAYQAIGFFILPLIPGKKKPFIPWANRKDKKPGVKEITYWWEKWPDAQIGVVTGIHSGVDVVGFDGQHALPHFEKMVCSLPDTYSVTTGREDGYNGNSQDVLFPGGSNVGNSREAFKNSDIDMNVPIVP